MSSDRNLASHGIQALTSLVDWDMSSDRNYSGMAYLYAESLVDWDMSSDRNAARAQAALAWQSSRLGYEL
jgi:hypothetical protein